MSSRSSTPLILASVLWGLGHTVGNGVSACTCVPALDVTSSFNVKPIAFLCSECNGPPGSMVAVGDRTRLWVHFAVPLSLPLRLNLRRPCPFPLPLFFQVVPRKGLLDMIHLLGFNPTRKDMRDFCNGKEEFTFPDLCQIVSTQKRKSSTK